MTDEENINTVGDEAAAKMISLKDGKVFGFVPLPEPFRSLYSIFFPDLVSRISRLGEPAVNKAVTAAAQKMGLGKAVQIGQWTGRAVAYGLPYIEDIANVSATVKNHHAEKKWMLEQLAPLLVANKAADGGGLSAFIHGGYGGNKMVTDALKVVTKHTYRNLGRDATNALPRVVQAYRTNLEGKLNALADAGQNSEDIKKKLHTIDTYGTKVAAALGTGLAKAVEGETCREAICNTALGDVFEIQEYVRQNELDNPKAQPGKYHVEELTSKITDAFQHFQKQQGHGQIPKQRMQDVAHKIAEKLVYGELHPLSLVNIIGKEELLTEKKNGFVSGEKIEKVIAKETELLSKNASIDVNAFMTDLNYSLEDLKNHLKSADKEEKAMLVISHPDPVLMAAGLKKQDILELRKTFAGGVLKSAFSAVIGNLAGMENSKLEEIGLAPDSIEFIRECEADPQLLASALKNPEQKEMAMSVVRTSLMSMQKGELQEIIKSGGKSHEEDGEEVKTLRRGITPRTHMDRAVKREADSEVGINN